MDGFAGISNSVAALTSWAKRAPSVAQDVALNAVKTIILLAPSRSGEKKRDQEEIRERGSVKDIDTAQYGIISVFLCYVVLWVFATVSPKEERQKLLDMIIRDDNAQASEFMAILQKGLGFEIESQRVVDRPEAPKILFRSAAEMLTKYGTWGASLNLALLLHKRSEM
jgi:hypothetical protein